MADLVEQAGAFCLYIWLVARLWPDHISAANWYPLLLLASEGIVVMLLMMRRRTENISLDLRDWAIALGGTFLALAIVKGDGAPIGGAVGPVLMLIGLMIHIGAKLSLWRSFGIIPAHRGVKVGGLYRFVRHPMYLGYMVAHVGYLLYAPSWWNLGLYLIVWSLLIARIFAEERVLGEDADYRALQERVRYRLVPGLF